LKNVDGERRPRCHPEPEVCKKQKQTVEVDQFNRRRAFATCLSSCLDAERARGEKNSAIRSVRHRPPKFANVGRHLFCMSFALEKDAISDKAVRPQDTESIYTAVAGLSGHGYLFESHFPENQLAQALKSIGR
jgi:hypothetical protein